jgi:hypothetical protein
MRNNYNFRFQQQYKGAVSVVHACATFYSILALEQLVHGKVETFKRSHETWMEEFTEYKDRYVQQLALMMRDYLIMGCYGEARHISKMDGIAWDKYESHWNKYPFKHSEKRCVPVTTMVDYRPQEVLEHLAEMFRMPGWSSSYGGLKWAKIADTALLYWNKDLPVEAWVDHCVDLTHNGGCAFNKFNYSILLLPPRIYGIVFQHLLDKKAIFQPTGVIALVNRYFGNDGQFVYLVRRADALGLIDQFAYCRYMSKAQYPRPMDPPIYSDEWAWENLHNPAWSREVQLWGLMHGGNRINLLSKPSSVKAVISKLLVSPWMSAVVREVRNYKPVAWGDKHFVPPVEVDRTRAHPRLVYVPNDDIAQPKGEPICPSCNAPIYRCRCGMVCAWCGGIKAHYLTRPQVSHSLRGMVKQLLEEGEWFSCLCVCPRCGMTPYLEGCSCFCDVCDSPGITCYCGNIKENLGVLLEEHAKRKDIEMVQALNIIDTVLAESKMVLELLVQKHKEVYNLGGCIGCGVEGSILASDWSTADLIAEAEFCECCGNEVICCTCQQ